VDTWCTAADVMTYAKAEVTDGDVLRAQATIDIHAVRLPADAARIGTRDLYWLKLATAYQAAWLTPQPDAFTRIEVTETGSSANRTMFAEQSFELGTLAKTALKRVSWLRSRSLHVRAADETLIGGDDNMLRGTYTPL
jgi:hypothetical protein